MTFLVIWLSKCRRIPEIYGQDVNAWAHLKFSLSCPKVWQAKSNTVEVELNQMSQQSKMFLNSLSRRSLKLDENICDIAIYYVVKL